MERMDAALDVEDVFVRLLPLAAPYEQATFLRSCLSSG